MDVFFDGRLGSVMDLSKEKPKQVRNSAFKSIFIVDPIKGERLHLAKLLKQEKFLMMTFERIGDCLKKNNSIKPDLIIYVLRKDKNEQNQLKNIKKYFKNLHFIILMTSEVSELNIEDLKESGFTSIHKASNQDVAKNFIYSLMPECQLTQADDSSFDIK
jgi:DNA-binding NtrC family response regulator